MVNSTFPASALLMHFFRQITKPLSTRIVNYAAQRPTFRRYFLLVPGRIYYRLENAIDEVRLDTRVKIEKDPKKIRKLELQEKEAIELGSQLMIEIVIFGLLVALVTLEHIRSQLKSNAEEKRRQLEIAELERRKTEAQERLEILQHEIAMAHVLRAELLREIDQLPVGDED